MAVAQPIHASTTSTAPPTLDLEKLNVLDAQEIIQFALQKHPDLAEKVSSTIEAADIRGRRRALEAFYDDLVTDVSIALNPIFTECDEDDYDYEIRRLRWERELYGSGGIDHGMIEHSITSVVESVEGCRGDERFEIAFKSLIEISQSLTYFEESKGGDGWESNEDLSYTINDVRRAMDDMALSWIKKDGKINDTIHARVLELVRGEYENEDEFIEDLDDTISCERDDEIDDGDNGEEGGGEMGEMAGSSNAHERQHKDSIGTNTVEIY
jgi:hypothetical protein